MTLPRLALAALLAANAAACAAHPWLLAALAGCALVPAGVEALAALERWGDGDTAALLASVARARRRT